MKKIVAMSLLAGSFAFAQSGLTGGADGLNQKTTQTLGQGAFSAGFGGQVSFDSWSLTRGGQFTKGNKQGAFHSASGSVTANINIAAGVTDFMDVGLVLPLYYDHANANGGGEGDMWKASRGDLELWAKAKLPLDEMTDGLFNAAIAAQFYFPTGDKSVGVRPRHAWYLNAKGEQTHPYTLNGMAFGGELILTLDLQKVGAPLRFNANVGFVGTVGRGSNTLVYGGGINVLPTDWMDFFIEANGEFRVEKGEYPRDPMFDPFTLTPGFRFHLPANIDIALGLDVGIRALNNFTWKYDKEMKKADKYTLHYGDKNGKVVSYGYTPTPRYAGTATLSWRFGNVRGADEDKDGVANNIDQCAGTPAGAVVDTTGCPVDSDNDGVFDGLDQCAETPAGAVVDAAGCPSDADNDGVFDGIDQCAETPAGVTVDAAGCPVDSDKDGIADHLDKCPNTASGAPIDANGCPLDSDKDGVPDYLDQCANTQAGVPVDGKGCPRDTDKDGVPDYLDKCQTPKGLPVNAEGCSPDADKDGIVDFLDKCAETPAGVSVDAAGCPVDSDKDGVADHLDKCPNTLVGVAVDKNGCPNKNQDLDKLKKGIQFKSGSAKLTAGGNKTLNKVVKLLKQLPNVNLEIQGHTDDVGKPEKNQKMSEQRAQAVVKYLVKKGIAADRLRAVGYGPDKPIADNKTKKGRALNRRVELVPFEK